MFSINWKQHPIGHGGFHTGLAQTWDCQPFSWIFDCGSKSHRKFEDYLGYWMGQQTNAIDWLFISHFHSDHVSGLGKLLDEIAVRNVMVPYLNDHEILTSFLHEIDRGTPSRAAVELHADPAEFFLSRGAERILFLGSAEPPLEPTEPELSPIGPKAEDRWHCRMDRSPISAQAPRGARHSTSDPAVLLVNSTVCTIEVGWNLGGIRLKPYRAPLEAGKHSDLLLEVESLVDLKVGQLGRPGLGKLAYAVANLARSAKGRAQLREAYSLHGIGPNKTSLSLLSMPLPADSELCDWSVSHGGWHKCGEGTPAWVNTADSELLSVDDLLDWQSHYSADLHLVKSLALPHHGSDLNSGISFATTCPEAALIAHVRSKSGMHPGPRVTLAADTRLKLVTENDGTAFEMQFHCL